ncbi:interferon-induced protein 44-like isoform X1 [Myxocyprinus asiaticus]|uniref:interferon-induced protein 44-like isoform X1 n=2 Tax=Myxocyprinus asiaticus TaxID=70543 RepID=UPI002222E449|nr:interferon-induced protein 44-like isoform X1 [Myxocyprinus asiaticus]XP_051549955.1 interferon-induced protein 44-like isoform X1 [Myxocyprinus asiaticus]
MDSLTSNLSEEKRKQLCALLGNVELSLLYKASVHGYNASAFHQRCDRQGPTLLVAYNSSGYIFGGYTRVDYAQSGQNITDKETFLFSFQGKIPVCIKVNSGHNARFDDSGVPNFGQQLYFCYNNQPSVYHQGGRSFNFNADTLYGNNTQLSECEVYKVKQVPQVRVEEKPWRNVQWSDKRKEELMELIRNHKALMTSVSRVRILMIGPVGAGKSSFFNSINSIFTGHVTSKAMAGSTNTSLTTQFRTYPVRDGREGKSLPFVLCDTMGLEEQSGAGLDIEDISSILQGHIPDRYKFNPFAPFQHDEQKASRSASLQEKIHCVVYVIDATKVSLMSNKLEEKLAAIRRKVNSLGITQIVLMTKVDEACPLVEKDLQSLYISSYIKTKVHEVSSRLGVPVSCVLPVKNYSQELELNLNCDVLLLTALQQMLRFADDYLDDIRPVEGNPL